MNIEIQAAELHKALTTVKHLMAVPKDKRAHMEAIQIIADGYGIKLVATNGRALALFETRDVEVHDGGQAVFKAGDVRSVIKLAQDNRKGGQLITIRTLPTNIDGTGYEIKVGAPGVDFTFLPPTDKYHDFPDYKNVMPDMDSYKDAKTADAHLNVHCLLKAVTCFRAAGAHVDPDKLSVDINFSNNIYSPLILTCGRIPELTVLFMPSVRGE
jgi:DNA polymerase III sliding clamp (beta) subunit (PCNA family)